MAILALASSALWADEETEVYRRIYMEADGLQQKYAAAVNLVELQDRSVAPVLSDALGELIRTQNNYLEPSEKELFARTVRLLAGALGDYKYEDAAPFLWSLVQQVKDPLARTDAIIALGKMRSSAYAEQIALLLRNLDIAPGPDRDADEKVAYGCIVALEKLKDARGFMPVFYATDAWYTQRVRQQAERALPNIAADPTDSIMELIRNETVERKLAALKQNAISKAPLERRIQAALLALSTGHLAMARDRNEAKALSDLRKLALRSLTGFKASGDDEVGLALKSFNEGFDDEERLLGLQALGANGSDTAATALRDLILKMDRDQKAGLSDEVRNRMAKAAIENAAITRNRIVRPALLSVVSNDKWSGGILLAAQNAIKAIP
jgi:hypothetical protein